MSEIIHDAIKSFSLCVLLSPVPEIHWGRTGGDMPRHHEVQMEGAQLYLRNVQFEDSGIYRCEAMNSRGRDYHTARVTVEGREEKFGM